MIDVTSRHEGDVLVLGLKGKLIGEPMSAKFSEAVQAAIDKGERKVVLDFSGVDWINSSGISMLLTAREKLQLARSKMRLAAINPSVKGVISMSKMDLVFEIHPSAEEAVRSFA
jgi:anti-sigma B factor antagonist